MKPNILLFFADQFRADALGCIGGNNWTPNLDALASRGCAFDSAYAGAPVCVPSRLSLASGVYPHQFGVQKNVDATLNPDRPNWMQAVRAAGYATSLFGKTHLHTSGDLFASAELVRAFGYDIVGEIPGPHALKSAKCVLTDRWKEVGIWDAYKRDFEDRRVNQPFVARASPLPLDLYYDAFVAGMARAHLRTVSAGTPWFCCVSFPGPHEPWDAPEPYAHRHSPSDMPPPRRRTFDGSGSIFERLFKSEAYSPQMSVSDVAALRANYAGAVSLIDDQIGGILADLAELGQLENTLVIFSADHGEMNGDYGLIYKTNFSDPAMRVPLIVAPPGASSPRRSSALIELMDVGATIADYAGAVLPSDSFARSFRDVIEGGRTAHRDYAVSEFDGHTCVVAEELKVEFDRARQPVLAFDRILDPDETTDVSRLPSYAARMSGVTNLLHEFLAATPPVPTALRRQ
jgi:arylsulfatase